MKESANNYLDELENEAIGIILEVYAFFKNPVILFSGGKDSIVLTHLARKVFHPLRIPFSILHIDTGHNFNETIQYRDALIQNFGLKLIVGSVQESINLGRVVEETHLEASRNVLQTRTLLDTINANKIDCAMGGARRDEEKSRAKERFFSHRSDEGVWDPRNQRPEIWKRFNTRHNKGEHFRVFPISNWTETDIWEYIQREQIHVPDLYFAHEREVIRRNNTWISNSVFVNLRPDEIVETKKIRFRTLGDITITGGIESSAETIQELINEVRTLRETERGNREDDKRSDAAMEDRKRKGYF